MSRNRYRISSLEIASEQSGTIVNQFIQQKESSEKLGILFPGMGYSCDRPLLYYTTELLLARGYDVLQLWSNYETTGFEQLSQTEKTIRIIGDGQALLQAGQKAGRYGQLLLCGKSLGTLTMAFIMNADQELRKATTVWFTPLIHLPPVAQAIQAIEGPAFIAGSQADDTFASGPTEEINSLPNSTTLVIDGADHSLEIPGDPLQSLVILNQVFERLSTLIH